MVKLSRESGELQQNDDGMGPSCPSRRPRVNSTRAAVLAHSVATSISEAYTALALISPGFTPLQRTDFSMAKGSKSKRVDDQPPSVEEDLYKILGVESDATPEAIKTAYRKNALKHHPGRVSSPQYPRNTRLKFS